MDAIGAHEPSYVQLALGLDPHQALRARQAALVAEHKPPITRALTELEGALERLAIEVRHAKFCKVFEPIYDEDGAHTGYLSLEHGPALEAAADAYATIYLKPDQAANTPLRCVGALGVEQQSIFELAVEVNRLKSVLKDALGKLGSHSYLATVYVDGAQLVRKMPLVLFILRQLKRASLNRLGAYRQIPLVAHGDGALPPPMPLRIGFSEQWVKSQARATLKELIALQHAAGRHDLVERLERSGIPGDEYVYQQKLHYLRMRAQYTLEHAKPSHYERAMAELPLLFLRRRGAGWPRVTPPRVRTGTKPRARESAALENTPIPGAPRFFRRQDPATREYFDPAKPPKAARRARSGKP